MVGQIDDCILIAYSPVINAKFIVICQGVGYLRVQAPRIILLSIRADVFQLQLVFSLLAVGFQMTWSNPRVPRREVVLAPSLAAS